MTEGCQQQEGVNAQLREELKALATENERLDGLALEFANAKERAEAERGRVLEEQKALQPDLVKATEQTKQVLERLADERAAHAKELAASRHELASEVCKLHNVELELVRLKPNGDLRAPKPRGRPPKQKQMAGESVPT